ncbi:hypothetical protein [Halocatena pleomorpha]|uniref:hypothetical protein n=1 Tax=Halocatena pleomorpha TaxID=1785090 RepID=UPI000F60CD1C|nr:hypothetical protein [Halocatena pleomorpha]
MSGFGNTTTKRTLMMAITAAAANFVVGLASCAGYLFVNQLPFGLTPGCPIYLGYTAIGVGVLGAITSNVYHSIPGATASRKVLALVLLSLPIYISGTFLPIVRPITEPAGIGVNMLYYLLSGVVVMGVVVYMYQTHE